MNRIQNKKVEVRDLGRVDYKQAWDYQEEIFKKIIELKIANRKTSEPKATPNYLLICQHPHVFTLGKSGDPKNLLINEIELKQRKAKYYKINRGGDITYHGPGQIVGYPILDLENFFTDIHKYLRLLEEAVILTLGEYDITAGRIEGLTGVWIDHQEPAIARKICAIGVRTSRWVTMHGLAFNINTDLSYFDYIVPCGIDDKAVTSLSRELGRTIELSKVQNILISKIATLFSMEVVPPKSGSKQ